MSATLIIMAAGMGSRYGEGIKQLEKMGPNGEILMEYSIYDALEAGFNKVVFIIRKDLEEIVRETLGDRIAQVTNVEYVFQELNDLPEGFDLPLDRKKPWGTGQAVLCCKDVVKEPFVIINADDYYGKTAFKLIYNYLTEEHETKAPIDLCMAGFILKNTLSDNGAVTRGICVVDESSKLSKVVETKGIYQNEAGEVIHNDNGTDVSACLDSHVSMNMWGGYPDFIAKLHQGFVDFLADSSKDELTGEYLLPIFVDSLIQGKQAQVSLLETTDKWFGVTYAADKAEVISQLGELISAGKYPEKLWSEK